MKGVAALIVAEFFINASSDLRAAFQASTWFHNDKKGIVIRIIFHVKVQKKSFLPNFNRFPVTALSGYKGPH